MLMYTSCGWFFDEVSGIETVQVLQYAGRVLQLNRELFGDDLEPGFLDRLDRVPSNLRELSSGRTVYKRYVLPAMVNLEKVGAHYAVSSLFEEYGERTPVYCYSVDREDYRSFSAGKVRLAVGRALMMRPRLMLLDEPSFGLAPLLTEELFRILGAISRERQVSMLVVEQNASLALGIADHAYLLETGRIVMSGSAEEIGKDESVRKAYLGY